MDEFIRQAMGALGTSEDTTKAATGALLGFLKKAGPAADVSQLLDALPGSRDVIAHEQPAGAGMLGGLGMAASALGIDSGGSAGLLAALTTSGLHAESVPKFVSMFVEFAKTKVGPDLVNRVIAAVPGIG